MSVFDPHNIPSTEDELSTYGKRRYFFSLQMVMCRKQTLMARKEYLNLMLILKTQKQSGSSFGGLSLHLQMELKISSIIKANLS